LNFEVKKGSLFASIEYILELYNTFIWIFKLI
jgi:hypothetical protein